MPKQVFFMEFKSDREDRHLLSRVKRDEAKEVSKTKLCLMVKLFLLPKMHGKSLKGVTQGNDKLIFAF